MSYKFKDGNVEHLFDSGYYLIGARALFAMLKHMADMLEQAEPGQHMHVRSSSKTCIAIYSTNDVNDLCGKCFAVDFTDLTENR